MAAEKNMPEIRFKGFEGEWEEEKLGKIGDTYSGLTGKTKVDFGHGDGKYITYMNVFTNTIANPKMTEPIEIDKSQNAVKAGDVLFTTSSETPEEVGMSSIWVENTENIYLNSFCFGYRPNIKFNNNYLAYVLRSSSMRKKIAFLAQGISRYNISKNRVMEIDIPTPNLPEQTQIGTYFQHLDNLISLHQRKYDKLLTVKKAMLEKMFPKEGADVPEIRFKGFEGKWERTLIGNIAEIKTGPFGSTLHADDYVEDGEPIITTEHFKSGNLPTSKACIPQVSDKDYIRLKSYTLIKGDIVFSRVGSVDINARISKTQEGWLFSGRVLRVRSLESIDSEFLHHELSTKRVRKSVITRAVGQTMPSINTEILKNTYIQIPEDINEQTKIGTFFQNLDTLITQHQKQLEKLKNMKKACLEKMFV